LRKFFSDVGDLLIDLRKSAPKTQDVSLSFCDARRTREARLLLSQLFQYGAVDARDCLADRLHEIGFASREGAQASKHCCQLGILRFEFSFFAASSSLVMTLSAKQACKKLRRYPPLRRDHPNGVWKRLVDLLDHEGVEIPVPRRF
jgi:hypothetical protein